MFYSGIKIREKRLQNAVSVRSLSEGIGMSRSAIYDIEKGAIPKESTAKKISDFLGIDVKDLIEYENEQKK